MYTGAIYEYHQSFLNYLYLEDMGIYTLHEKQKHKEDVLELLEQLGKSLKE